MSWLPQACITQLMNNSSAFSDHNVIDLTELFHEDVSSAESRIDEVFEQISDDDIVILNITVVDSLFMLVIFDLLTIAEIAAVRFVLSDF